MTDKQSEALNNSIVFMVKTKEVMRITLNGVHVADGVSVDEATAGVIDVLDVYIKNMVQREVKRLDALNAELVEALQAVVDTGEMSLQLIYPSREAADKAKAALAKAEGK